MCQMTDISHCFNLLHFVLIPLFIHIIYNENVKTCCSFGQSVSYRKLREHKVLQSIASSHFCLDKHL